EPLDTAQVVPLGIIDTRTFDPITFDQRLTGHVSASGSSGLVHRVPPALSLALSVNAQSTQWVRWNSSLWNSTWERSSEAIITKPAVGRDPPEITPQRPTACLGW